MNDNNFVIKDLPYQDPIIISLIDIISRYMHVANGCVIALIAKFIYVLKIDDLCFNFIYSREIKLYTIFYNNKLKGLFALEYPLDYFKKMSYQDHIEFSYSRLINFGNKNENETYNTLKCLMVNQDYDYFYPKDCYGYQEYYQDKEYTKLHIIIVVNNYHLSRVIKTDKLDEICEILPQKAIIFCSDIDTDKLTPTNDIKSIINMGNLFRYEMLDIDDGFEQITMREYFTPCKPEVLEFESCIHKLPTYNINYGISWYFNIIPNHRNCSISVDLEFNSQILDLLWIGIYAHSFYILNRTYILSNLSEFKDFLHNNILIMKDSTNDMRVLSKIEINVNELKIADIKGISMILQFLANKNYTKSMKEKGMKALSLCLGFQTDYKQGVNWYETRPDPSDEGFRHLAIDCMITMYCYRYYLLNKVDKLNGRILYVYDMTALTDKGFYEIPSIFKGMSTMNKMKNTVTGKVIHLWEGSVYPFYCESKKTAQMIDHILRHNV